MTEFYVLVEKREANMAGLKARKQKGQTPEFRNHPCKEGPWLQSNK